MENTEKVINLLNSYMKLEKDIEVLTRTKGMSQDILKESQAYRSFVNTQYELKGYFLNGEEILEIYKDIRNIAEQKMNSKEEEHQSEINNLEEVFSNLKNSKTNLRNLILDQNNFFNGKIIDEIKREY
ncbi:MAG: hypothetical protein AABY06_01970 [Nanoarchaeota archaeon]